MTTTTRRVPEFKAGWPEMLGVVPVVGVILGGILAYKYLDLEHLTDDFLFVGYGFLVLVYLLSRFVIAATYKPPVLLDPRPPCRPTIAIVIPAMNEQEVIERTIQAAAAAIYPEGRVEIIAVDDGSGDATGDVMESLLGQIPNLSVVRFKTNRGKREAMAEGIRRTTAEVVVFVDSDSRIAPDALERIAQYFAYEEIGAVAGYGDVDNADRSPITRMQAVRYYVAFNVVKAAEAKFGSVTCCSGCFSAYRRTALQQVMNSWLGQTFLGTRSTYGDDRSLTNYILRAGWKTYYAPDAHVATMVPETLPAFLRQQLRWKKSWIRETLAAARFMWKRHPMTVFSFYSSIVLTLMAPHVILRAVLLRPLAFLQLPFVYAAGVVSMALVYGLFYRINRDDRLWKYGMVFALLYTTVLVWQLPYALFTLTNTRWGTRR
ncbi:MAG TPA: glycosyltransferase [Acidimicrobiia bacterium]|nr:glycosyltransferase [Acidimicrobiia bacterium]